MDTDTRNNATLAWIIAAVLAVVSVVLLVMLVNDRNPRNLNDARRQILADCAGVDEASRANCARSLEQLEEIVLEVRRDLENPPATEEAPVLETEPAATTE